MASVLEPQLGIGVQALGARARQAPQLLRPRVTTNNGRFDASADRWDAMGSPYRRRRRHTRPRRAVVRWRRDWRGRRTPPVPSASARRHRRRRAREGDVLSAHGVLEPLEFGVDIDASHSDAAADRFGKTACSRRSPRRRGKQAAPTSGLPSITTLAPSGLPTIVCPSRAVCRWSLDVMPYSKSSGSPGSSLIGTR